MIFQPVVAGDTTQNLVAKFNANVGHSNKAPVWFRTEEINFSESGYHTLIPNLDSSYRVAPMGNWYLVLTSGDGASEPPSFSIGTGEDCNQFLPEQNLTQAEGAIVPLTLSDQMQAWPSSEPVSLKVAQPGQGAGCPRGFLMGSAFILPQ